MKKLVLSTTTALLLSTALAVGADMPVKAPPPAAAAPVSPFDIAFGVALLSDYNFRGITQSNHQPSVTGYFEPRFNINENWQLYAGVGGYSIEFPNNAAAEIDIYGGIRPTFGKFAFDFGVWYYYYPGGRTFSGFTGGILAPFGTPNPFCTNLFTAFNSLCNVMKSDMSFVEFYGKMTYNWTDNFATGTAVYYNPNWLNTGATGWYLSTNAKYTGTAFPSGWNWYASGELSKYYLGTTDLFYALTPLPDYYTWNVGIGLTYKVFTLDFRYYDSDLSKAECNVLTGDHTAVASPAFITPINGSGLGSNWCGPRFIVALKADVTLNSNIK